MEITDLKREDYEEIQVNSSRWLSLDNLKNECWKDIKDFERLYQVSNYGRVKSLKRNTNNHMCITDRILRVGRNTNGYYIVILCKDHKKYTRKVHILVAKAFIPNPLNKPCVDHDEPVKKDYCNNCVYNLRWATLKENMEHCVILGRFSKPPIYKKYGKEHHGSKPVMQFDLNSDFIKQWWSLADIERELGFCRKHISQVIHKENYIAYGYKWKFGIYEKER